MSGAAETPRWTAEDDLGLCESCGDPIERGQTHGTRDGAHHHDDCLELLEQDTRLVTAVHAGVRAHTQAPGAAGHIARDGGD